MRINLNQILQPVPNMWVLYIATAAAFLLDQASKVFVLWGLNLPQVGQIEIAPHYLNFRMAWNYGMNFGLFARQPNDPLDIDHRCYGDHRVCLDLDSL